MRILATLFFAAMTLNAHAGMLVDKTRVIFHEGEDTQGINVMNINAYPAFVQVWVDTGDINNFTQSPDAPFVLIPPIFNLRADEVKSVKIIYDGKKLPADRESLFWINLYEVPAVKTGLTQRQYLLMSMKTQLKLIYRPKSLRDNVTDAGESVSCTVEDNAPLALVCRNPSGYFLSYNDISVSFRGHRYQATAELDLMLPPFSTQRFGLKALPQASLGTGNNITFRLINDAGEREEISHALNR